MARTALVTGGTRGIGAAISKALKAAGYKVAANYAGNDEAANKFKAETGIPVYKFDVSNYEACGTAIAQISNSPENASAVPTASANTSGDASAPSTAPAKPQEKTNSKCAPGKIQHLRPTNQCGVNMFEPPKDENEEIPFDGLKVDWGVGFSQTAQSLKHQKTAQSVMSGGVNQNQLMKIGTGFNYAVANLYLNAQLADGIRMAVTMYLSARHHQETWVKDGYVMIDKLPLSIAPYHGIANTLFDRYLTVKVGHQEVNYGDAHFRRTDNGNGVYNPFIGNYLMDAFTTEIGAEVYATATESAR